jgi:hypothetical protein
VKFEPLSQTTSSMSSLPGLGKPEPVRARIRRCKI